MKLLQKIVMHFGAHGLRPVAAVLALGLTLAGAPVHAAEVTVFAAASLTDALKKIASDYEAQSVDRIVFNCAASSTLARQIEEGAPADIFFSADESRMNRLADKGLIMDDTRVSRLSNALVIIVAKDADVKIGTPADLATDRVKWLALAEPRSVPAGIYARQFLEKQNLWTGVADKVVPTENVRAALAAVESGNVEAGMVYKTDAAISKKVRIAYEVPVNDGPQISYPVAMIRGSAQPEAARRFLEYLNSAEAGRIFVQFGFVVRPR